MNGAFIGEQPPATLSAAERDVGGVKTLPAHQRGRRAERKRMSAGARWLDGPYYVVPGLLSRRYARIVRAIQRSNDPTPVKTLGRALGGGDTALVLAREIFDFEFHYRNRYASKAVQRRAELRQARAAAAPGATYEGDLDDLDEDGDEVQP